MDLALLKSQVREVNFTLHGTPATVTVPDGTPTSTRVIWLTPDTAEVPASGYQRSEAKMVIAVPRDDVPAMPRGTIIASSPPMLAAPALWQVDGMETIRPDHHRVVVVPYEA